MEFLMIYTNDKWSFVGILQDLEESDLKIKDFYLIFMGLTNESCVKDACFFQFWQETRSFFHYNNKMGSICVKTQEPESSVQDKGRPSRPSRPSRIASQFKDFQAEKISEIKEFLTLTAQNTNILDKDKPHNKTEKSMSLSHQLPMPKPITDFKVVRGLGKGAFGQVFMVKDTIDNKFYAMKIILKESITSSQQRINTLSERLILEAVNHPFIVKLYYAFQSERKLYLLCDLMPGGELFYLLRRNKKFPEDVAKFYAAEILLALEYLHSRNIIYRDLKPENVLLDQDGHIKLTDFGLSKVCFSEKQVTFSICGTPQYIAPEIIQGKGYTQTADWFSFGSLLYDMLTGRPPFYSANKTEIIKNITTRTVPIPESLSPEARSLLRGLFKINPTKRLGYTRDGLELREHPFFADVDFNQILKKTVEAPISFRDAINDEGFDVDFQGSPQSTLNMDHSLKEQGLIFDGFTYYKAQASPQNKKWQAQENFSVQFRQQFSSEPPSHEHLGSV